MLNLLNINTTIICINSLSDIREMIFPMVGCHKFTHTKSGEVCIYKYKGMRTG